LREYEGGLANAGQAADLHLLLVTERGEANLLDLALALNSAVTRAMELGRPGDALQWFREATGVYRKLARAQSGGIRRAAGNHAEQSC
jgi:hypothetical protein